MGNAMNQKKYSLIYSMLLHFFVLALALLKWNGGTQELNLGESHANFSSYVYQENLSTPVLKNKASSQLAPAITAIPKRGLMLAQRKKSTDTKGDTSNKITKKEQKPLSPTASQSGNGRPIPELVALLHAAIQKQQQYPASALQMEREGSATLLFVLFPNGMIEHLKIVKPSGTAVLDEAAMTAVNNALPFKGVDKYLKQPQTYQITVGFELT